MPKENPIQKVQAFLNSEPTDTQRNVIWLMCVGGIIACPLIALAVKLLAK
jgi:hypothetical protein